MTYSNIDARFSEPIAIPADRVQRLRELSEKVQAANRARKFKRLKRNRPDN